MQAQTQAHGPSQTMASVKEVLERINSTLKSDPTGPYLNYSCKEVSWDDAQRGTVGGGLSCWGANITDTRLHAKDGRSLFTVRGDNWNERLGKVSSNDIALVTGDEGGGGGVGTLRPQTLRKVLSDPSQFGSYAKLTASTLADDVLDRDVSVRFQTTFLPVASGEKTRLEFAPEAYNYNTVCDEDPCNLIFLCTSQGLAVQQDGKGAKKLYHHGKDENGVIQRYWLEAESSDHKVGGSQVENKEEKEDALARGKATSSVIGLKAMGTRFNVLMTIQIPLKQKPAERTFMDQELGGSVSNWEWACEEDSDEECQIVEYCLTEPEMWEDCEEDSDEEYKEECHTCSRVQMKVSKRVMEGPAFGKSSAARVSRGSRVDSWEGLTVKHPKRHPNEHITVTVVMYYTCAGGVPTEKDVKSAIDDLEELYQSVQNGLLAEDKFKFMKSELTVKDVIDIKKKIVSQPPPKPNAPIDWNVFPV